jgi:sulfatase maturation enzyme AslB (radical SAM superfamily)
MVVLSQRGSDDPKMYDLSFMYTKRCNLSCSFCMYNKWPGRQRRDGPSGSSSLVGYC